MPTPCDAISICDSFDGGNCQRKATGRRQAAGANRVELEIRNDVFTEFEGKCHKQWFYFKANFTEPLLEPSTIRYEILNAGQCAFPGAWPESTVCYSFDRVDWRRELTTTYDAESGTLGWDFHHEQGNRGVYFAYFPPFTMEQHLSLIEKCSATIENNCSVTVLGQTLEGRDLECVKVGTGPLTAWVIHRQHPGETQAEYFAQGLLTRLLGLNSHGALDGLTRQALQAFTFYIVPNMCPDGSFKGHLRTNAAGANLNREWCTSPHPYIASPKSIEEGTTEYEAPTLHRSPEVFHVLNKMDKTGVDVFTDVHGDEALPFNFLAGGEGLPNWGPRLEGLHGAFAAAYCRANPDMQREISYEPDEPKQALMCVGSNQVGARFNCLSATLEMPYKDCFSNPDAPRGWSTARCEALGASLIDAYMHVKDYLRSEEPFWMRLPREDAYVRPTELYQLPRSSKPRENGGLSGARAGQEEWIHLKGEDAEEAAAAIRSVNPRLTVEVIGEGDMVTMDHRPDRVRIRAKESTGKVAYAPTLG